MGGTGKKKERMKGKKERERQIKIENNFLLCFSFCAFV
jgi:hypothetical protein